MARLKISGGDAGFQAASTSAPGRACDRVPHFRLAAAAGSLFVVRGVFVVGMNLHGKFFFGKNKFYEQRKRACRSIDFRSGPCAGKVRHTSPSFCPAKGPDAKRHSTPVIQASPKGSAQIGFFGK